MGSIPKRGRVWYLLDIRVGGRRVCKRVGAIKEGRRTGSQGRRSQLLAMSSASRGKTSQLRNSLSDCKRAPQ